MRQVLLIGLFMSIGCGGTTRGPGSDALNGAADGATASGPLEGGPGGGNATPSGANAAAATGSGGSSGSAGATGVGGSSGATGAGSSSGADPSPTIVSVSAGDGGDGSAGGGRDSGRVAAGEAGTGSGPGPDAAAADPSKKITVWLAGDSTMQPCGGCICGWGSQFQSYLSTNATVVDSAVGGRSIQTWLYDPNVSTTLGANGECAISPQTYSARWQAMLDPATGMKPGDYLFIEFGINDGSATCDRHVGTALFQTYLATMARAAKARGAQPIVLTSTNAIICSGAAIPINRGFLSETKAVGMTENVPVIDLTQLTADYYAGLGLCPNDGNYSSTTTLLGKLFCDHTHTKAAGAMQTAGVVAKAIRDQNLGLAAYLLK